MRARVQRIVIFSRYTPFVGPGPTYSGPLDVRLFSGGTFVGWQGTGLGLTAAEVEYTMEMSQDLEHWIDAASVAPSAGAEEAQAVDFEYPWMRWRADVTGIDPGVTGWLVGEIVFRDDAGAGGGA